MPCYQERTTTLEIQAASLDVMARTLEALGMQTRIEEATRTIRLTTATGQSGYFANGRLVVNGAAKINENVIRREYAKQSILSQARKQGWQLRFLQNGQIEATKRRFA